MAVSFHIDLTKFVNNDFANKTLGKVVFRDLSSLKLAIERQITGTGISINECKKLHKFLEISLIVITQYFDCVFLALYNQV